MADTSPLEKFIRSPQLVSLQMLRAVAALLVVMFHTQSIFGERLGVNVFGGLFSEGSRGVDLFFVLSGFVITYVHLRDWGRPERLGTYLFNRVCRIYPSVWIISALAIATYFVGTHLDTPVGVRGSDHADKFEAWNLIAGVFLLPQKGIALVNVTWTLKHEMLFYLLFALPIIERRFFLLILLLQTAVLGCVLGNVRFEDTWIIYILGPIKLEFGLGMLCAYVVMHRDSVPMLNGRAWPAVGLLLGTAIFAGGAMIDTYWHDFLPLPELMIYGIGSALVVACAALVELSGRLPKSPLLISLGDASYSIYLVHFAVIATISGLLTGQHFPAPDSFVALIVAGVGVIAGVAFHRYVDRPVQRVLRPARRYLQFGTAASQIQNALAKIKVADS